jgi:hypothetical protein
MVERFGMSTDVAPHAARVLVTPELSSTEVYDWDMDGHENHEGNRGLEGKKRA